MKHHCPRCNAIVAPTEVASCNYETDKDSIPDGSVTYWTQNTLSLLLCPECKHPFLVHTEQCLGTDDIMCRSPESQILYPSEPRNAKYKLPDVVDRLYNQAIVSFRTNSYDACVLLCRTVIESICREKGVEKSGGLNGAIAELKKRGQIDGQLFEWFNLVRVFGNRAAHEFEIAFSKDEAADCLDFVEAICDYIYYLVPKFEQMKIRRASQGMTVPLTTVVTPPAVS